MILNRLVGLQSAAILARKAALLILLRAADAPRKATVDFAGVVAAQAPTKQKLLLWNTATHAVSHPLDPDRSMNPQTSSKCRFTTLRTSRLAVLPACVYAVLGIGPSSSLQQFHDLQAGPLQRSTTGGRWMGGARLGFVGY